LFILEISYNRFEFEIRLMEDFLTVTRISLKENHQIIKSGSKMPVKLYYEYGKFYYAHSKFKK